MQRQNLLKRCRISYIEVESVMQRQNRSVLIGVESAINTLILLGGRGSEPPSTLFLDITPKLRLRQRPLAYYVPISQISMFYSILELRNISEHSSSLELRNISQHSSFLELRNISENSSTLELRYNSEHSSCLELMHISEPSSSLELRNISQPSTNMDLNCDHNPKKWVKIIL